MGDTEKVCVCERERKKEREIEGKSQTERGKQMEKGGHISRLENLKPFLKLVSYLRLGEICQSLHVFTCVIGIHPKLDVL